MKLALFFAAFLVAGSSGSEAACVTPSVDQLIKLDGHPFAIEPTADNCYLFVSYQAAKAGMIAVLENDVGKVRLIRTVDTGNKVAGGLSLSHDGRLLAVAGYNGIGLFASDRLITGGTNPKIAALDEGDKGAIFPIFAHDDRNLFVSEEQNNTILVIDVALLREGDSNRAKIGRIPVGRSPVGLALSPDGALLFATSEAMAGAGPCPTDFGHGTQAEGALFIIDTGKAVGDPRHGVRKGVKAGCSPVRVVVSADGRALWVSERGSDRVLGLDPTILMSGASRLELTSVSVGKSPIGLAIRGDASQLWVANSDRFGSGEGSVTVIAPARPGSAELHATYGVGRLPRDVRFMPDGKTLVLALFKDDTVGIHRTDN